MNIIIDTHIFLWLANGDLKKIKSNYLEAIEDLNNNIYFSSISVAEIMIKKSIGNLVFDGDILDILDEMGIDILDFDAKNALYLGSLPFHHRDPFDRMIISQSLSNNYSIITVDSKFVKYDCKMLK
jgi:PIN domain nuclease of toxin-antitoxin system